MGEQLEMFDAPPSAEAVACDAFDAEGAALRLRVCHEWASSSNARPSYAVFARGPWVSYEQGGKDFDAFDRKIERRARELSPHERRIEFEREFVWLAWGYKVGRATVPVAVLADHANVAKHLTREIATESARGFAMIFDAPAEAVVRWVLTGEVMP